MSNSQVIAHGKAEYSFDCYKHMYSYSLIVLKCMRLPTNHIALPMTLSPYPQDHHQFQLRHIYQFYYFCIVVAHLFQQIIDIHPFQLKGNTALKTSRLYSFQPRHVLLPYLSITMYFNQSQYSIISFTCYYVVACGTSMMHYDYLLQHAITEGCYAVRYYNHAIRD